MTIIRYLLAWAFYLLGGLVGSIMGGPLGRLYPAYNKLMIWSTRAQGDGNGPWIIKR